MATKTNSEINGNKYYRIRRKIDGKMKNFYGTSKGDAEKKYKEYVEEQARLKYERQVEMDTATFGDRAKEYVENVLRHSQKYSTGTKYRYERAYKVYVQECPLTDMLMKDIRPSHIQKFYNELDVSMQTMKSINKFMSAFYKWVALNDYGDNILSAVEVPKKPDNKRHDDIVVWDEGEVLDILDNIEGHRLAFFVKVLLYTGARISEAIALKYSDFDDETVTICRQFYMKEMKEPKYNSVRQIPLHDELRSALATHKRWHDNDMIKNGYKTDYVFTTSTGKLYDPVNVRRALRRFCAKHDIEYKHPHAFRATFCTQLCRCGVPLEVASALMGHKSMEVTAKHYALVRNDTKRDAIDKLHY